MNRKTCLALFLASLPITAPLAPTARAQVVAPPVEDEPLEDEAAPARAVPGNRAGWTDADVEGLIFRGQTGVDGRGWLVERRVLTVEAILRVCEPTASQGAKLSLAARGDQRRISRAVEGKLREFRRIEDRSARENATVVGIWPLQQLVQAGAFGRYSLLDKVARSTLDAARVARYDEENRQRRLHAHRARIELTVALLDGTLGLDDGQRHRFVEALVAGLKLPDRPMSGCTPALILYTASNLPESSLRPIFDEAQWKILTGMLIEARGQEAFLKVRGLLLDDSIDLRSAVEADQYYTDILR